MYQAVSETDYLSFVFNADFRIRLLQFIQCFSNDDELTFNGALGFQISFVSNKVGYCGGEFLYPINGLYTSDRYFLSFSVINQGFGFVNALFEIRIANIGIC